MYDMAEDYEKKSGTNFFVSRKFGLNLGNKLVFWSPENHVTLP